MGSNWEKRRFTKYFIIQVAIYRSYTLYSASFCWWKAAATSRDGGGANARLPLPPVPVHNEYPAVNSGWI